MSRLDRQSGVALVIVLWMLVLLTAIAAGFAREVRTEVRLSAAELGSARSQALAEAGIYRAVYDLLSDDPDLRWPADGRWVSLEMAGATVEVRVQASSGRVDLNAAPAKLLNRLFEGLLPDLDGEQLADLILDWRDSNTERRPHGAEDDDYRRAGMDYGSRDGPFRSVSELQWLLEMTPARYAILAPHLTIHSGLAGVDPRYASRDTLRALSGVDEAQVEQFISMRESPETDGILSTAGLGADEGIYLSRKPNGYTVVAKARQPGGAWAYKRADIRLAAGSRARLRILSWQNQDPEQVYVDNGEESDWQL